MPTHKRITKYQTEEGFVANVTESVASDATLAFDNPATIAASAQIEIDFAFPFAKVKGLLIQSTRAVTIHTNATGGAGGDTLVIPAGAVLAWLFGDLDACPFTIDVTKLYATNNHATLGILAGGLKIRVLLDVTP
jgi:hypothetical protein